jgi:hypothetical protein
MAAMAPVATAAEKAEVNVGVDFFSRYVWRGFDFGSNPSIQPALTVGYYGFELGVWGAYSLSPESSDNDEIDFWLSYKYGWDNGLSITAIVTDYYFPNAGIKFSYFGAHTVEPGLSITMPEAFPLTVSGYVNVQNDAGNNTYFQLDYPATAGEVDLDFFFGVAGGSTENSDYYDTDKTNVINVGMSASRAIKVTESFSIPLTGLLIYNPRQEKSYLVVGMSF